MIEDNISLVKNISFSKIHQNMLLKSSHVRFTIVIPFTTQLKTQILYNLQRIYSNSAWGYACRDFVQNQDLKKDSDYRELLDELQEDICHGPFIMKEVLGDAFQFFQKAG